MSHVRHAGAFRIRIALVVPMLLCLMFLQVGCSGGAGGYAIAGHAHHGHGGPTLVVYNAPPAIDHFSFPDTTHAHGEFVAWHADLDGGCRRLCIQTCPRCIQSGWMEPRKQLQQKTDKTQLK